MQSSARGVQVPWCLRATRAKQNLTQFCSCLTWFNHTNWSLFKKKRKQVCSFPALNTIKFVTTSYTQTLSFYFSSGLFLALLMVSTVLFCKGAGGRGKMASHTSDTLNFIYQGPWRGHLTSHIHFFIYRVKALNLLQRVFMILKLLNCM